MQPRKDLSLEQVLLIAENAKNHARTQILMGSTQLENNALPLEGVQSLGTAVYNIRELIDEQGQMDLLTKIDYSLAHYEHMIAITSKYSLGNCDEMAVQALDYILYNCVDVRAETYSIVFGDHVFLVLNRERDSTVYKPETWGDNCVICDPWANKVYKASEYHIHLKDFKHVNGINLVKDYNQYFQWLIPISDFNSTYLKNIRQVSKLKFTFLNELTYLNNILVDYFHSLQKEINRLLREYSENNSIITIITKKIDAMSKFITELRLYGESEKNAVYSDDFRTTFAKLNKEVNSLYRYAAAVMAFSKDEKQILFANTKNNKAINALKFFGIKCNIQSDLEHIDKNINQSISRRFS